MQLIALTYRILFNSPATASTTEWVALKLGMIGKVLAVMAIERVEWNRQTANDNDSSNISTKFEWIRETNSLRFFGVDRNRFLSVSSLHTHASMRILEPAEKVAPIKIRSYEYRFCNFLLLLKWRIIIGRSENTKRMQWAYVATMNRGTMYCIQKFPFFARVLRSFSLLIKVRSGTTRGPTSTQQQQ